MNARRIEFMDQGIDERMEPREVEQEPRKHIGISPPDERRYTGAVILDESISGIGLMTALDLAVGSLVTLNMDDTYFALGEVTNISEVSNSWQWQGMRRVGIQFTDKSRWAY